MARQGNQVDQRQIKEEYEKRDFNNVIVLICLICLTVNCLFWAFPVWTGISVGLGKLFGGTTSWKTFWYLISFVLGLISLGGGYWANKQQK
jgi:hypothetical protein